MVATIEQELRNRRNYVSSASTLYFGGGTPSVLTVAQIGHLIELVKELWGVKTFDEVTLEANPEDLTPEYIDGLLGVGVDRLSIGIQSFHDEHLLQMNRRHTAAEAIAAVSNSQKIGFNNITIDLIYGLPWLSEAQWLSNIETALSLNVPHISAYHLTIEPRTVLGKRRTEPVAEQVSEQHFDTLHTALQKAGYEHYEVSNFATEGHRAIHNSGYWSGQAYLGVGPSAHSYNGSNERQWNVSSNKLYMEGAVAESEMLTSTDLHNEYVMTRLRTADGFSIAQYESLFSRAVEPFPGLIIRDGRARIASENFLTSDSIISSLFWA